MDLTLQKILDASLAWSDRTDPITDMLGLLALTFFVLLGVTGLHSALLTWYSFMRMGGCFRFAAIFPITLVAYFMYYSEEFRSAILALSLIVPGMVIGLAGHLYKVASHCFGLEYPPSVGIKVLATTVVFGLVVMFVRALHRLSTWGR